MMLKVKIKLLEYNHLHLSNFQCHFAFLVPTDHIQKLLTHYFGAPKDQIVQQPPARGKFLWEEYIKLKGGLTMERGKIIQQF